MIGKNKGEKQVVTTEILKLWKELTEDEKKEVLRRITLKASGIELPPMEIVLKENEVIKKERA